MRLEKDEKRNNIDVAITEQLLICSKALRLRGFL